MYNPYRVQSMSEEGNFFQLFFSLIESKIFCLIFSQFESNKEVMVYFLAFKQLGLALVRWIDFNFMDFEWFL